MDKTDGEEVFLTRAWVRKSVNYKLTKKGLVYPMFYRTLFWDMREEFSAAVQDARQQGLGLWPSDKRSGVTINTLADITDKHPIFPKLFRRIIEHWGNQESLQCFVAFLEAKMEGAYIFRNKQKYGPIVEIACSEDWVKREIVRLLEG